MNDIIFRTGGLSDSEQKIVQLGFDRHSVANGAPEYAKERVNWVRHNSAGELTAVLTGNVLWDWLYVDELWVDENLRGTGLGGALLLHAQEYCEQRKMTGLWLWTQSWQAADFYESQGYEEFATFPDFPQGYKRFGFRKIIKA